MSTSHTFPAVKERRCDTLPHELLSLKKNTSWSWGKMNREFHRVMGHEGPCRYTLFRYAMGMVKRRNVVTERYVREATHRVTVQLAPRELSEGGDMTMPLV